MALILFILFNSFTFCQYNWYNHSELNWHTLETEHFLIHFHDETERSAREAAEIVERIYLSITKLYNYEPIRLSSLAHDSLTTVFSIIDKNEKIYELNYRDFQNSYGFIGIDGEFKFLSNGTV